MMMREAPTKNIQFYLGQMTQTCGPTDPPNRFWEIWDLGFGIWDKKVDLKPKIMVKYAINTVIYKSLGQPDPTHTYLGQ